MNTENPYANDKEPTPRQALTFGSALLKAAVLPKKELTQFWIDKPGVLASRMKALLYRPVRFEVPYSASPVKDIVMSNLVGDGLVVETRGDIDAKIVDGFSQATVEHGEALARSGIIVILRVIPEDAVKFHDKKNIFPFSGNQHSVGDLERFVRDVLFQVRDRFYCGPIE